MPAERLWPLSNEATANRLFEEISEVEEALLERCHQLLDQAKTIRDLSTYHWWPQTHDTRGTLHPDSVLQPAHSLPDSHDPSGDQETCAQQQRASEKENRWR
jgi:hypothetical protein